MMAWPSLLSPYLETIESDLLGAEGTRHPHHAWRSGQSSFKPLGSPSKPPGSVRTRVDGQPGVKQAEIKKGLEHFLPVPGKKSRARDIRIEGRQRAISEKPKRLLLPNTVD